jgi:hypothetical protein
VGVVSLLLKDMWRALCRLLRRAEPAYLTQDLDDALGPELDVAAQMRAHTFPGLEDYARMRLGADAPSERALLDALERSARTIPPNYIGEISLVSCPCTEVIRFVPFENTADLVSRGWTVIENWYADYWRIRRWAAEQKQPAVNGNLRANPLRDEATS